MERKAFAVSGCVETNFTGPVGQVFDLAAADIGANHETLSKSV